MASYSLLLLLYTALLAIAAVVAAPGPRIAWYRQPFERLYNNTTYNYNVPSDPPEVVPMGYLAYGLPEVLWSASRLLTAGNALFLVHGGYPCDLRPVASVAPPDSPKGCGYSVALVNSGFSAGRTYRFTNFFIAYGEALSLQIMAIPDMHFAPDVPMDDRFSVPETLVYRTGQAMASFQQPPPSVEQTLCFIGGLQESGYPPYRNEYTYENATMLSSVRCASSLRGDIYRSQADLPAPRAKAAATFADGRIYVFGGVNASREMVPVEELMLSSQGNPSAVDNVVTGWTAHPQLPASFASKGPRAWMLAASNPQPRTQGHVYGTFIGGGVSQNPISGELSVNDDLWWTPNASDVSSWQQLNLSLPSPLTSPGAVAADINGFSGAVVLEGNTTGSYLSLPPANEATALLYLANTTLHLITVYVSDEGRVINSTIEQVGGFLPLEGDAELNTLPGDGLGHSVGIMPANDGTPTIFVVVGNTFIRGFLRPCSDSSCREGTYPTGCGSITNEAICMPCGQCAPGNFTPSPKACPAVCQPCSTCDAGFEVLAPCTNVSNTVCVPIPAATAGLAIEPAVENTYAASLAIIGLAFVVGLGRTFATAEQRVSVVEGLSALLGALNPARRSALSAPLSSTAALREALAQRMRLLSSVLLFITHVLFLASLATLKPTSAVAAVTVSYAPQFFASLVCLLLGLLSNSTLALVWSRSQASSPLDAVSRRVYVASQSKSAHRWASLVYTTSVLHSRALSCFGRFHAETVPVPHAASLGRSSARARFALALLAHPELVSAAVIDLPQTIIVVSVLMASKLPPASWPWLDVAALVLPLSSVLVTCVRLYASAFIPPSRAKVMPATNVQHNPVAILSSSISASGNAAPAPALTRMTASPLPTAGSTSTTSATSGTGGSTRTERSTSVSSSSGNLAIFNLALNESIRIDRRYPILSYVGGPGQDVSSFNLAVAAPPPRPPVPAPAPARATPPPRPPRSPQVSLPALNLPNRVYSADEDDPR
jgi:hypothetical protein